MRSNPETTPGAGLSNGRRFHRPPRGATPGPMIPAVHAPAVREASLPRRRAGHGYKSQYGPSVFRARSKYVGSSGSGGGPSGEGNCPGSSVASIVAVTLPASDSRS